MTCNEDEHGVNDGLLSGLEWMGSSGRKAQLSVCRLWQAASYIISQDAKLNPVPTPRAALHELSAAPRRRRKRDRDLAIVPAPLLLHGDSETTPHNHLLTLHLGRAAYVASSVQPG